MCPTVLCLTSVCLTVVCLNVLRLTAVRLTVLRRAVVHLASVLWLIWRRVMIRHGSIILSDRHGSQRRRVWSGRRMTNVSAM